LRPAAGVFGGADITLWLRGVMRRRCGDAMYVARDWFPTCAALLIGCRRGHLFAGDGLGGCGAGCNAHALRRMRRWKTERRAAPEDAGGMSWSLSLQQHQDILLAGQNGRRSMTA